MSSQFSGPWLPWFHGDFLRATQGWTLLERGAYFMLLGASWEMGALPNDHRRLAGIICVQLDEFEEVWKAVGPKFEVTEKGLINQRLEVHRSKQEVRSEKARQSAKVRWGERDSDANGHANASANASANGHANAYAIGDAPAMLLDPDPDPDPDLRTQNTDPKQPRARARTANATPPFHQQVIDLYHELCPDLPKVVAWSPQRVKLLDARISDCKARGKQADTLEYWRKFFGVVAGSDFLCGRAKGREDEFHATLEWLLKPSNFLKVIELNYSPRASDNGSDAHG